jgi:hypothetical protein
MEHRIFHGQFSSMNWWNACRIHFNRGNLIVQKVDYDDGVGIQIKTRDHPHRVGIPHWVSILNRWKMVYTVQVGQQTWMGIAASLGIPRWQRSQPGQYFEPIG